MHVVAATFVAGYLIFGFWYAAERFQNPAAHPGQVLIEATLWFPVALMDAIDELVYLIRRAR